MLMRFILSVFALSTGLQAAAAPPCAEALERLHANYFTELQGLRDSEVDVRYGGYIIGALGLGCVFKAVACGATMGVIFAGSRIHQERLVSRIQRLEDGYKLYEVYDHLRAGDIEDESVQALVTALDAPSLETEIVYQKFLHLVDSGQICGGGSTLQKSWNDVISELRQGAG